MSKLSRRAQQKQLIAVLRGKSSSSLELSPNDVLVQIALPLILILAIIVNLLTVAQSSSNKKETQDGTPLILELWKQQVLLRIDRILSQEENDWEIASFADINSVQWDDIWPNDTGYSSLCKKGKELGDIITLKNNFYRKALMYVPTDTDEAEIFQEMYDSKLHSEEMMQMVPEEYWLDEKKRQYALGYIGERLLKWRETLENLQWATVEKIIIALPLDSAIVHEDLATQMEAISQALEKRGYPLLPSVIQEYSKNE